MVCKYCIRLIVISILECHKFNKVTKVFWSGIKHCHCAIKKVAFLTPCHLIFYKMRLNPVAIYSCQALFNLVPRRKDYSLKNIKNPMENKTWSIRWRTKHGASGVSSSKEPVTQHTFDQHEGTHSATIPSYSLIFTVLSLF